MPRAKTSPESIASQERGLAALALRKQGKTYDVIAAQLGFASRSGAYEAVKVLLRRVQTEDVEELRALENDRLDDMLDALQRRVTSGEPRAIEVAIKLLERRARLAGLDAPTKISVSDEDQARAYARSRGLDEEPFLLEWRGLSKG